MTSVPHRPFFRVVTYNVHGCLLPSRKVDPMWYADIIADLDADIVALQEVDKGSSSRELKSQAEVIGEILGFHTRYVAVDEKGFHNFGLGVLTRLHILNSDFIRLPNLYPWFNPRKRGALQVLLQTQRGPIQIVNTHLSVFTLERRIQLEALLRKARIRPSRHGQPLVLCGDLNAQPNSSTYRRLSRYLTDVQTATNQSSSPKFTFHSRTPVYRIDHIFISSHLRALRADVKRNSKTMAASDHLPLTADLVFQESP